MHCLVLIKPLLYTPVILLCCAHWSMGRESQQLNYDMFSVFTYGHNIDK